MNTAIIAELEEQRRDALVDYYLGQIIPSAETSAPPTIITPEDLYEYLLIDNQVNAQVETSRVAQAIASIQQYIHAVFNGMEPGYPDGFDTAYLQLWREGISEYSVWAGYQMIEDYPENYIDPTLRLKKTDQFKDFEMDLGQSRITEESVQSAVRNYLSKFERVSNLKVVSGYIDGTDFKLSDYYFVGRENVEPFSYYWRKAEFRLTSESESIPPTIWGEWKKIDVALAASVIKSRLVVVGARLYLVWLEVGRNIVDKEGSPTSRYEFSIRMAYKQLNDMWSPQSILHTGIYTEGEGDYEVANDFVFVVTIDQRFAMEPRLVITLESFLSVTDSVVLAYDKLFFPILVEDELVDELLKLGRLIYQQNPMRLQFPYDGSGESDQPSYIHSVTLDEKLSVTPDDPTKGLNQTLSVEVSLMNGEGKEDKPKFLVQGFCEAKKYTKDGLNIYLGRWHSSNTGISSSEYRVYSDSTGRMLFARIVVEHKNGNLNLKAGKWFLNGRQCGEVKLSDYRGTSTRKEAVISLNFDYMSVGVPSSSVILSGGGFYFEMADGQRPDMSNSSNVFSEIVAAAVIRFNVWYGYKADDGRLIKRSVGVFSLLLNGAAKTPVVECQLEREWKNSYFSFGVSGESNQLESWNAYNVVLVNESRLSPVIVTEPSGACFLNLESLDLNDELRYVRLNTLLAKELTSKALISIKSLMGWETQHTLEPPSPAVPTKADDEDSENQWVALDFNGANGRYFWEIFFHVPHLVAYRLNSEFDYVGAENWLHYIFNPLVRIPQLYPAPTATMDYWVSRPLTAEDEFSYELDGLGDPDAIAYSVPSHYRKVIVMLYMNNLISRGDSLYRMLTRDTLNEAKLHYVRALSLLGSLNKGRSISKWEPIRLQDAAKKDSAVFADFSSELWDGNFRAISANATGQPWLRLLNAPWFRLPVNTALLDQWERLGLRLSNLRNNLTLDGKPLQLALYEPPANPMDLLRAQLAAGGSTQRRLGSLAIIPPYRFRAMLPRVQSAVEILIRYGDQVRSYMEMRDRANQEELQQSHILEFSAFTQTLQKQALEHSLKSQEVLEQSKRTIESRKNYYDGLIAEDVSKLETAAIEKQTSIKPRNIASGAATTATHIFGAITPVIFGVASGGMLITGTGHAAAAGIQTDLVNDTYNVEQTMLSEQYRRRRVEWTFQVEQAELELEAIDKQLELQTLAIQSAETSQAQAIKAQEQAQAYYSFLKNRATGPALYQWLLSQMATMYFQAYDVVLSMCLSAEACWQYEIGDRDTHFVPTNAWTDNYHGLTAGEALKLGLLRMESAYLNRHERRLELTKTVSLRKLFELKTKDAPEGIKWEQVVETFLGSEGTGTLPFNLTALAFDQDYPGHYLRQLVNVSVSIPAVIGPYQDIRATLTQLGSRTLMKPDIDGVKSLYLSDNTLPEGEQDNADGTQVMSNPRAYQQIGISHGVDDRGLFNMDFGDERYYPFEGTGAVSSWQLHFPRHTSPEQAAMLASLTDIIVHVRYLAVDGGIPFHNQVEALMDQVEKPPTAPAAKKRATAAKKKRH
ncbi:neuraminidase-like domain-containing protein [Pseudomonas sp.]|uniref:Tc toxin subunit A-related protein n=1 Tax=Pseudomonas sp. TaxID=306 RepID=UPI00261D12B8|nr:neuraminidase-like domain-containing protein [Pseudomonas sp.]